MRIEVGVGEGRQHARVGGAVRVAQPLHLGAEVERLRDVPTLVLAHAIGDERDHRLRDGGAEAVGARYAYPVGVEADADGCPRRPLGA